MAEAVSSRMPCQRVRWRAKKKDVIILTGCEDTLQAEAEENGWHVDRSETSRPPHFTVRTTVYGFSLTIAFVLIAVSRERRSHQTVPSCTSDGGAAGDAECAGVGRRDLHDHR